MRIDNLRVMINGSPFLFDGEQGFLAEGLEKTAAGLGSVC